MRLLLATRNEHKRREFARLLPGVQIDMLPDDVPLPPEDGETFAANALPKARAAASATGRAAIADDSGIEAQALGGAPGVRSARYAGENATDEENLCKLLEEAPPGSALRYVCALAYVDPASGVERVFEGSCSGTLTERPRGDRGFGYDPAFVPDEQPDEQPCEQPPGLPAGEPGEQPSGVPADGENRRPMTMAELSDEQKDSISHRGNAARALLRWIEAA